MANVRLEDLPGQTSPGEKTNAAVVPLTPAIQPTAQVDQTPPVQQSAPVALTAPAATPASNPALTGVNSDLASRVNALIAASHGRINVQSGFRTYAQQVALYKKEPNLAAPPGHSNHEKGLAVDLGGDYALIAQLAPQFGLVLPMSWEPWHVELPGQHTSSSPLAYTQSPYGDPNPTADPNLTTTGQYTLANASDAMQKLTLGDSGAPLGELTGPTGAGVLDSGGTSVTGVPGTTGSSGSMAMSYSTTPGQGGGGTVSPADLYKMLVGQGLDPVHAAALVSIAGRESGYRADAHNGNAGTGDNSYGLFQINLLGGMHSQFSPQMLTTAQGSAAAAAQLVKAGGLSAWGPYKGVSWANGTNLQTGVEASGGQVTLQQLEGITGEGLNK